MKKRIIALLTLMVLLVGMFAFASAETKPSANLHKTSQHQTITAGETITFTFSLRSGSYKKVGDAFRAKLVTKISKGSKQLGTASWVWTGTQKYQLKAKIAESSPAGTYKMAYTTYYREDAASSWQKVKTKSTTFKVK
jgi:uncharacterized protein (DUF58 family)